MNHRSLNLINQSVAKLFQRGLAAPAGKGFSGGKLGGGVSSDSSY